MTKQQIMFLRNALVLAVVSFFIWVTIFFNLNITEESTEFVIKQNEWVTTFVEKITEYWFLYLVFGIVLIGAYYIVTKKPARKIKRH